MTTTENVNFNFKNSLQLDDKARIGLVAVSEKIFDAGCVYSKSGVEEASKTGLYVPIITTGEQELRRLQVRTMGELFRKGIYELVGDSDVQSLLGIRPQHIDLAIDTNPKCQPWTTYFGLDLCGESLLINDLNSDRAVVVGYQPEFVEAFADVFPQLADKMRSFYLGFIPVVKELAGKDDPDVFILTAENDPHRVPFSRFAQRFGWTACSIKDLPERTPDLVLRQIKSEVIIGDQDKYKGLLKLLKEGMPMVNPLGSFLAGNKGWVPLLAARHLVNPDWFPNSWIVNHRLTLGSSGQEYDLRDILPEFLGERKRFVLKRAFSAGGYEVHVGAEKKKWEWDELWRKVCSSDFSWEVEERQAKNEADITVADWEKKGDPILISNKRLNLLERVYSVGQFDNFCSEVFGSVSWKVNASGYTFPVCLDVE